MTQKHEFEASHARNWIRGGAICLLFATASSWAVEGQPQGAGLRGLVPSKSPAGLKYEDFELLDGNWATWGTETNALVEKLYSDEALDVPAQRSLLAQLKSKAGVMETALKDRSYSQLHGPLADLHGRLVRRLDFYAAVLDVLEADPLVGQKSRIASSFTNLSSAIASTRSDISTFQGGHLWVPYLQLDALTQAAHTSDNSPATIELLANVTRRLSPSVDWNEAQKEFLSRPSLARLNSAVSQLQAATSSTEAATPDAVRLLVGQFLTAIDKFEEDGSTAAAEQVRAGYTKLKGFAPDGGATLSTLMRSHYYNYNLRVVASEGMLQSVMGDSRQESSWINQCVMGARVNGSQCTNTSVNVDLRPSSDTAFIQLTVNGQINANTTGSTSQATVLATGNHHFHAEKGVFYDGRSFSTTQSSVGVNASTNIYSARTRQSWIPILGRIADNIALDVAQGKTGEANAYTASQIRDEVGPRLDNEARSKFDKATLEIESRVWGPLREQGMYPDAMHWSSTDSELLVRTRLMEANELGGTNPPPNISLPANGLLIQTHESLMSNFAERLDFAGETMTNSQVRQRVEDRLTKLFGKSFNNGESASSDDKTQDNNKLVFDKVDPIRFQVDGGKIMIIMRAGLITEKGEEIPVQTITVPYTIKVVGNQVVMERGYVKVVDPDGQVIRQRVMIQHIQKSLGESKTLKGEFNQTVEGKTIHLTIVGIDARDGWLSIQAR